jgi:glycosyltransferase involved in cell wall biosynthesis
MRVVICSDGVFPDEVGGMQRHTRLLVETLAKVQPELPITVLHTHPGRRLFDVAANVTEVGVDARPGRKNYLRECYELSARFAAELRRIPGAIIYSQGLCVWQGIHDFSPRLIVNPHGLEPYQGITLRQRLTGTPYRFIFGHIFKNAARVVSLGGRLTTILRRHVPNPDRRIVVLPNGVELPGESRRSTNTADGVCRLLFVGRFAANKGIPDLLQAMQILVDRGLGAKFELHLVGDGPLLGRIQQDHAGPHVFFHGKASDTELDRLYRSSDVFVLPTLFEGMPTVVLEAMARQMPIIVTDVGATRELVDETNGFVIRKRNPSQLADTLVNFAGLPPMVRHSLGNRSLEKARERFNWPQIAAAHHKVFVDLDAAVNGNSAF